MNKKMISIMLFRRHLGVKTLLLTLIFPVKAVSLEEETSEDFLSLRLHTCTRMQQNGKMIGSAPISERCPSDFITLEANTKDSNCTIFAYRISS